MRTTHATKANDTSSRSHAITQIKIQEQGVKQCGKLLLVDLAGSERAQDCQSNNKDRQAEGAEINQSLLGLKECVRALDQQKGQASQGQHVPFRQSKLTMVLRDSFLASEKVKIVMLTCICPGMSSANHTLNSLRYAERLKEKSHQGQGGNRGRGQAAQEQTNEELRLFMEKHGKTLDHNREAQADAAAQQQARFNNMFYQDDRIDELEETDQDMQLLNDDANDLVMGQEVEDDVAIVQASRQQPGGQYSKKSPNAMAGSTRKGTNLQNISNTVHGNARQGTNQSQLMRQQQPSGENKCPSATATSSQPQKRVVSHQNQFSNKQGQPSTQGLPSSKMSPALAKAMGGAQAKGAAPRKTTTAPSAGGHMQIKPRGHQSQSQAQDIHVDQVP